MSTKSTKTKYEFTTRDGLIHTIELGEVEQKALSLISRIDNDKILVLRDSPPDKSGDLYLPTAVSLRCATGTILLTGPSPRYDLFTGVRIVFSDHAGMMFAPEGPFTSSLLYFFSDHDVIATLHTSEPRPDNMIGIPESWKDFCSPRPGFLFVKMVETALVKGRIEAPPEYREHTQSTEGIIEKVGTGIAHLGYQVGDRVQLSTLGSRSIKFGPREENQLWEISPKHVICVYKPEAAPDGQPIGASVGERGFLLPDKVVGDLDKTRYEEGNPKGLR